MHLRPCARRWTWGLLFAGALALTVLCALPFSGVLAEVVDGGDVHRIEAGETYADDLTVAAGKVVIEGTLDGDLIAVAESISITGEVTGNIIAAARRIEIAGVVAGDVMAGAESIEISGEARDDVRVAGAAIEVSGTIGDDLFAAAGGQPGAGGNSGMGFPLLSFPGGGGGSTGGLSLTESASVGGDAHIACGTTSLDGNVAGSLELACASAGIGGSVGGDARIFCSDADIAPEARVAGLLKITSSQEVTVPEGVAGEVELVQTEAAPKPSLTSQIIAQLTANVLYCVLAIMGLMLLCLFVVKVTPGLASVPANALARSPLWAGLVGLGVVALLSFVPAATCLLALVMALQGSEAALGMVFFIAGALLLLWNLSPLITGLWLGRRLRGESPGSGIELVTLVLGVLVIVLLGHIPILGFLVYLASLFLAAGGIVLALSGRHQEGVPSAEVHWDSESQEAT